MKLYQTENQRHQQFGAVVAGGGSPKGLGTAANKPLMQKLRAPESAAAMVLLPRTLFCAVWFVVLAIADDLRHPATAETADF